MVEIELDDKKEINDFELRRQEKASLTQRMTSYVMNLGIAKDETTAAYIILSVSFTFLVGIFLIMLFLTREPRIKYNLPPQVLNTLPSKVQKNIRNANK